jgi:outer membrane protein
MYQFRLTKNLLSAASGSILLLAAGCAAMAQTQTAPQTAPAVRAAAPVQPPIQTAAASTSPSGNIVALPTRVAIINIQQAVMATKEGLVAGNALKQKFAPKQTEFEKRQADIQSQQDLLKKGSATMSAEAKDKLQREIDAKIKSLQRDAQDAQDDSQQDMGKIYNELGEKMVQIIEQYAYQNGYAVVLDVSSQQTPVIWAAPSTNITADIIALYDQAHPGVAPAVAPKPLQAPSKQPAVTTPVKKQ